jgi:hypothetical protein
MVETPITSAKEAYQGFLNGIDTNLATVIPDPGDGGTIDVSNSGTLLLTSGASNEGRDLPAPTFEGQRINVCFDVDGGGEVDIRTLTDGFDPGGTDNGLIFDAAGESARIYAVREGGTLVWRVLRADNSEPTLS